MVLQLLNFQKVQELLDLESFFVIIEMMFFNIEEVDINEDDIPTKKEIKK